MTPLALSQLQTLLETEIDIVQIRTDQDIAPRVAIIAGRGKNEGGRVKPLIRVSGNDVTGAAARNQVGMLLSGGENSIRNVRPREKDAERRPTVRRTNVGELPPSNNARKKHRLHSGRNHI